MACHTNATIARTKRPVNRATVFHLPGPKQTALCRVSDWSGEEKVLQQPRVELYKSCIYPESCICIYRKHGQPWYMSHVKIHCQHSARLRVTALFSELETDKDVESVHVLAVVVDDFFIFLFESVGPAETCKSGSWHSNLSSSVAIRSWWEHTLKLPIYIYAHLPCHLIPPCSQSPSLLQPLRLHGRYPSSYIPGRSFHS